MPVYHRVVGWLVKLGLLRLVVTQQFSTPETRYEDGGGATSRKSCAIFTHMNKAAGTTIKTMMYRYSASSEEMSYDLYSNAQYLEGPIGRQTFLDRDLHLVAGGCTEELRFSPSREPELAVEGCKWFTMFRQ